MIFSTYIIYKLFFMATATAKQDDDLLIIDDDTDTSSSEIEFSFDPTDEAKDEISSNEDISVHLGTEKIADSTLSELREDTMETEQESSINLGVDFQKDSEEKSPQNPSKELKNQEEDFSFDLGIWEKDTSTGEENTWTEWKTLAIKSDESLNDIMSATITKLQKRQESIVSDISSKRDEETAIKEKIKKLQLQVKEIEADIAMLDTESRKITSNISDLEKMKLDPVKEHNAKRVVKK